MWTLTIRLIKFIYICKDKRKSCKDRIVIESLVLNPTMGTDVFRVKTVYLNCLNPSSLKGGISLFLDKPYKSYALTGDGVFFCDERRISIKFY